MVSLTNASIRTTLACLALLCNVCLVSSVLAQEPGPGEVVSLQTCVENAMRLNPGIGGSRQAVEAAQAHRKSIRGSFGPSLMVSGNVRVWDEETIADFGGAMGTGGMDLSLLPSPSTVYETIIYEMLKGFGQPTVVQEQVTAQMTATVVQPLTPLLTVLKAHKLAQLSIDDAQLKETETRMNVALAVVSAYFGLLQARSVMATLESSQERMQAHLHQMQKLFDADLVGKSDVLKVKVAQAQLGQAMVQTRNMVALARANLATQVGWGPTRDVRVAEYPKVLPAMPAESLEESIRLALERRPELRSMKLAQRQAELGRKIVLDEYVPTVAAMGSYVYNRGSSFMDNHSFFVGLDLNWTLWEWGRTYYKADEAAARTRQVQFGLEQIRNFLSLEVKKARLDLQSAMEEYHVVEVSVAEAEENYRVQKKLYEAAYRTSTDLIDAEAAMTEAYAQRDMAFHRAWMAYAAYGKAVGKPVTEWLPNSASASTASE